MEAMKVRSFREIVKMVKHQIPKILGFDHCQVFFTISTAESKLLILINLILDKNLLFTLTNCEPPEHRQYMKREDHTVQRDCSTNFAHNYYFLDDEVVIFPNNLGITS